MKRHCHVHSRHHNLIFIRYLIVNAHSSQSGPNGDIHQIKRYQFRCIIFSRYSFISTIAPLRCQKATFSTVIHTKSKIWHKTCPSYVHSPKLLPASFWDYGNTSKVLICCAKQYWFESYLPTQSKSASLSRHYIPSKLKIKELRDDYSFDLYKLEWLMQIINTS